MVDVNASKYFNTICYEPKLNKIYQSYNFLHATSLKKVKNDLNM